MLKCHNNLIILYEQYFQVCKLCYTGFIHSFWVVRNASFLLFAELLNYILGHLNSEFDCGYRFYFQFLFVLYVVFK